MGEGLNIMSMDFFGILFLNDDGYKGNMCFIFPQLEDNVKICID